MEMINEKEKQLEENGDMESVFEQYVDSVKTLKNGENERS